MKYSGRDNQSHRNYTEMKERTTTPANSEVTVRPITEAELEKFKQYKKKKPEPLDGMRWKIQF